LAGDLSWRAPARTKAAMSVVLELALQLPPAGSRDVRQRLHAQLKAAILDGRLAAGVQLPASRALAEQLSLSRNTAMAVYDLLLSEGHIVSRPGAGTFVAGTAPKPLPEPCASPRAAALFNLRPGRPDTASFPFDIWGRLTGRALRRFSRATTNYREPAGHPALREAIAGHLSFARALACAPEDIVVTVGAQQAFDLVARTLVAPGRTVVVEDPGYPAAREAFAAAGAKVVAVPVDREGLVVGALPEGAALVCVTPSQQYPLGAALSPARREALLAYAARNEALIVEDDYGGEFRFEGPPQPTLRAQDRDGRVVYVGTFSQSLLPALRIGFVVAPERVRAALTAARERSDWHGPAIEHATLAAFIAEGHLARHVRKMRRIYAERRAALLAALATHAEDLLDPIPAPAGLHITALLRPPIDARGVVQRASALGVAVDGLGVYAAGAASPPGLVLGFGQVEAARIDEAVRRLAQAVREQA
jgi:GntR family transcriptional regulator/MocR family aminotransferase